MIITTRLTADLQQPGYPPIVNAVQSDQYSRAVCLALYSGGASWTVPPEATVAVRYTTPAGTRGYYDTMPDGAQAYSVSGNEITICIAPQMLTSVGLVPAQVELLSGSSILGTFPFHLRVWDNLAAQVQTPEDYVNWLQWMQSRLEEALVSAAQSGEFTGPPPALKSQSVTYQTGASGTTPPTGTWQSTVPTVLQGQYLWTRTVLQFDTGDPITTYQVGYMGVDATVQSQSVTYQAGASGTTPPTGTWQSTIPTVPQGQYLWTRVIRQFNSGASVTSYGVSYMGKDGVSAATETTVTYQAGDSGTTPPMGTWASSIPSVPQGKYLWTRIVTTSNVSDPVTGYCVARMGVDGEVTQEYVDTALATERTYTNAAVRSAAPYNLLDNSDFRNPVNQRGATTYTGNWIYCIDRWQINDTSGSIQAQSDGLKLSNSADGHPSYIYQRLEKLQAGTYTLAAKFHGNTGAVGVSNYYTDSGLFTPVTTTKTEGIIELIFSVPEEIDYATAFFRVDLYGNNAEAVFEWGALYEGAYTADTLPEYRPKGYAAELAECQRYFVQYATGSGYSPIATGTMHNSSGAYFIFRFPVPMRITPTLKTSGAFRVYVNGAGRNILGDIVANAPSKNSVRIIVSNISDGVAGQSCELQASGDASAYLSFSADL